MSVPRIHVREQADEEIDNIAQYIATRNYRAGQRFYDATEGMFERLAFMPGIGTSRPVKNLALGGLRSCPVPGYDRYLIFYIPLQNGGIDVVHVLHGMRDVQPILERG